MRYCGSRHTWILDRHGVAICPPRRPTRSLPWVCITLRCKKWCYRQQKLRAQRCGAECACEAYGQGRPRRSLSTTTDIAQNFERASSLGRMAGSSRVRQWAGFPVQHDPERLYIAGVLLEESPLRPRIPVSSRITRSMAWKPSSFPKGRDGYVPTSCITKTPRIASMAPPISLLLWKRPFRRGYQQHGMLARSPLAPSRHLVVQRRGSSIRIETAWG